MWLSNVCDRWLYAACLRFALDWDERDNLLRSAHFDGALLQIWQGSCRTEIAAAAHVERLIPFHFSRRYEEEPDRVYAEVRARCARTVIPWQMRDQL
jgi:hypothetical protein